MAAVLTFALVVLIGASERIEIRDGKLPAPGSERCIRLHATGPFQHVTVRVNGANAGELANQDSELDITGYLSPGAGNSVKVEGRVERVWAWISPLVYISSAKLIAGGWLEDRGTAGARSEEDRCGDFRHGGDRTNRRSDGNDTR